MNKLLLSVMAVTTLTLTACGNENESAEESKPAVEAKEKKAPVEKKNYKLTEANVKKVAGESLDVKSVDISKEDRYVTITANVTDSLAAKRTMIEAFSSIDKVKGIDNVCIAMLGKDGSAVYNVVLSKETRDSIDFDNFDHSKLKDVAERYYEM